MGQEIQIKGDPGTGMVSVEAREVEAYRDVINDFMEALNVIQDYQRVVDMLCAPDPNTIRARTLLNRYNRESLKTNPAFRVLMDGRDITDHVEIEASAEEVDDD